MERSVVGKAVTIVGCGKSGEAAARLALRKGARVVTVQDKRDASEIGDERVLGLARDGARLELGGHKPETLAQSDLIVLSPGVPDFPALKAAEAKGVKVVSEVELAAWYLRARVLAITGTNGKSTVTTLTGEMVKRSGLPTFVGGNLGTPVCDAVDSAAGKEGGAVVLELSSYQLERTYTLRPRVAVLLNVTPDHLDRYGTMARYAAAKQRIFLGQTKADHAAVPAHDPLMVSLAKAMPAKVHTWAGGESAVRVVDGAIVDGRGERYPLDLLKIRGAHNVDNAMACVLSARLFGVSAPGIREALGSFEGLPHRMQFVAEKNGVVFLDDSKATNVGATLKALAGVDRRVVLIAGGRDKGGSYEPLREPLREKGRGLVVLGEAAELIEKALGDVVRTQRAGTLEDAVAKATAMAQPGDAVLLAPACSSLDMFQSYEHRGRAFAAAVRA